MATILLAIVIRFHLSKVETELSLVVSLAGRILQILQKPRRANLPGYIGALYPLQL
jgi:hypothetical protein